MRLKARQLPGFKYWERVCSTWEVYLTWKTRVFSARQELDSQSPRPRNK